MKKILFLTILILILTGCNDKKCIKSHEEESTCYYYIYHKIGEVNMMTPIYYLCTKTICDEYEG